MTPISTTIKLLCIVALFFITVACAQSTQQELTIEGRLDHRLDATFVTFFRSTNLDDPRCTTKHLQTGRKRAQLMALGKTIKDGNYSVSISLEYRDEKGCKFVFVHTSVRIYRKYDKRYFTEFPLMSINQYIMPDYQVDMNGGVFASTTFGKYQYKTNKKHFLVPKKTELVCSTQVHGWSKRKESEFYCAMEIVDDKNGSLYENPDDDFIGIHPYFGIDNIESTSIHLDILTSDKKSLFYTGKAEQPKIPDYFREIPKPDSVKIKEFFRKWKEKIFGL